MAILILICTLVAVGLTLWLFDRGHNAGPDPHDTPASTTDDSECCGMHITCEKDSLLASVSDEIVYFEDEELDRHAGRNPDTYTEPEIEEFRDVLITLKPEEIAGWGRSIQLRGIQLPAVVRDELLMIVAEARQSTQ